MPFGRLASWWRPRLTEALAEHLRGAVVWDLLPGEHSGSWKPGEVPRHRRITVRFLDESGKTVAHWNKLLKSALVRHIPETRLTEVEPPDDSSILPAIGSIRPIRRWRTPNPEWCCGYVEAKLGTPHRAGQRRSDMRAAVLEQPGEPTVMVDDLDIADPGPGQVTVEVEWCGLCHSDLSLFTGVHPAPLPIVMGHEAAGRIAEVGPGVTSHAIGDPVIITPVPPCGRCYWCVRDQASHCVNSVALFTNTFPDGSTGLARGGQTVYRGLGVGGFAERVVTAETGAIPVPDAVPLEVAAVVGCAVQTGVGAVFNTAHVRPGDTVVVLGLGGVGMSIVAGASAAGAARIFVSDPQAHRRDLAAHFGATDAVDPTSDDVVAAVQTATDGIGADHAFEAVGSAAIAETALSATRNGGTTVLVGAGPIDETLQLSPTFFAVSGKRLLGCLLGGANSLRDIPMILNLYRSGRLDLEALVTARRPLTELQEAAADMTAGVGLRTLMAL